MRSSRPSPSSIRQLGRRVLTGEHLTRLPRASEDRGTPLRDDLKTCCSETSTDQYIIYNIKMGLFESVCRPAKTTPSNLPSPVYLSRHRSHGQAPIYKSSVSDYCKGSIPGPEPASDRSLTPSRTRLSSPLVTAREQQPWYAPTRM